MGFTNIRAKYLIVICLLWATVSQAQTTTIPDKLKVKTVPHSPALGDMMVTVDTAGNIKKDTIPTGGGSSATGVNGLTGSINIGMGGTLSQNTTTNLAGFNFILNQTGSANPQQWKLNNVQVANLDAGGQFHAAGMSNLLTGANAQIATSTTGVYISRSVADGHAVLNVQNFINTNTANILNVRGVANNDWLSVGYNGFVNKNSYIKASAGSARGELQQDILQPIANGDILVGLDVRPVFGVSIISGLNTLAGGSGYGTSVYNALLTGGTGSGGMAQLTSTGGAITAVSLLNPGVNYTVGDVLGAAVTDINGNPIGTGFSIHVSAITSYSGISSFALRTFGLDQYDQDYSSTYTNETKTSKRYVDARVISGSYNGFGSATTTFTVTIGSTQPNNTYKVQITPTSSNAVAGFYVTNKTTTTFDVVYPSGLSGVVRWDYSVLK
jgi:hypothetical protein